MTSSTIVKAGLVCVRAGRLLLVRSRGSRTWVLPGGKIEAGDATLVHALRREVREELNCEVGEPVYLGVWQGEATGRPGVLLHLVAYGGDLVGEPRVSSEIEEARWFPLDAAALRTAPSPPSVAEFVLPLALRRSACYDEGVRGVEADAAVPGRRETPPSASALAEGMSAGYASLAHPVDPDVAGRRLAGAPPEPETGYRLVSERSPPAAAPLSGRGAAPTRRRGGAVGLDRVTLVAGLVAVGAAVAWVIRELH